MTLLAGQAGVYASFWLDSDPAPTVILLLTLVFVAVFAGTLMRRRGVA